MTQVPSDDHVAVTVREWLADWGEEVAAVRMDAARRRFTPDVVAFGTRADVVRGIDQLYEHQWHRVWPAIEDFRFENSAAWACR